MLTKCFKEIKKGVKLSEFRQFVSDKFNELLCTQKMRFLQVSKKI